MFKLTHKLPEKYWVAVSGGVDSMSALHWLHKPSRNGLIGVVHIDHRTPHSIDAKGFVESFCREECIECLTFEIEGTPPPGESKELYWRNQRYHIFKNVLAGYEPVILAHHFDDCLEEYLMNVMVRGYMNTIPYSHHRCIRPFRLWKRKDIIKYAERNNIPFIEDPSNADVRYKRNFIRKHIVPEALTLNPGIYNIVEKLILIKDNK
jgi:tRNA(Ile)-lysidine synthase